MKTIWKFPFSIMDSFTLAMPGGAKIVMVAMQGKQPCIWAIVRPENPAINRCFVVTGTGHPAPADCQHVGSFIAEQFVWHLWEALA